jgi:hypothetical protein
MAVVESEESEKEDDKEPERARGSENLKKGREASYINFTPSPTSFSDTTRRGGGGGGR